MGNQFGHAGFLGMGMKSRKIPQNAEQKQQSVGANLSKTLRLGGSGNTPRKTNRMFWTEEKKENIRESKD